MNAGWWGPDREPVRLDQAIADTLPGLARTASAAVSAAAGPTECEGLAVRENGSEAVAGRVESYRLPLPRWDTAWEQKRKRKTGKTVRHRAVWDVLHLNARPHWRARHRATREVAETVVTLARAAQLHRITDAVYVDVLLVWSPGDRRRADSLNLTPLVKACGDALAQPRRDLPGLRLVPDDTDEWMSQRVRIARPPEPAGLWLDVAVARG
ncbi:hypothetical protein [Pseudonocardia sp. NPDC049635]|uniref:hypothetical protein n=1 Tax=Pseudonocardia sp. NPDC049635 TaxID=3155506 RepID=UPI0033FFF61F